MKLIFIKSKFSYLTALKNVYRQTKGKKKNFFVGEKRAHT